MAKNSLQKCEYLAPQFFDFDATESSFNDDYFNGRVSLWSRENIKVDEETVELSGNDEKISSKSENWKTPSNPAIENIKKDYRVPSMKTPVTPAVNIESPSHESPELEYTRPWLNKSCSSLTSAMNALEICSASGRISSTPSNSRNFNVSMETSTPFVTVNERSKTRFVETRMDDSKTSECREVQSKQIITRLELQEAQNSEINTQVESEQDIEVKTAKFSGNNEKESEDNNLKNAKAAGTSPDQIVPTTAINSPNNEENTRMQIMISEKSEPDYTKEVAEKFCNDSAENIDKFGANLPEPADDLELDEHFVDAEAELSKLDSQVDATEQKEENGRRTKTRKTGVLVNKARRQSNKFRRQSGKYVSMAEAILKFQKGTPKRFYSTKRIMKSGPLQAVAQSSRKLTLATSPVLLCKSRCRRTIASNQQEKQTTEKNNAKRVGTSKKNTQTAPSNFDSRKNDKRDKIEDSKKTTTKKAAENIPATATTSRRVKTLPGPEKMMKTKSEAMPGKSTSLTTKTKSFSGLANKRAKSSSELILKTTKKTGASTSKTDADKIAPGATKKIQTKANAKSTCALSFEERNKLLLKKREEFAKRMIEQEKQARVFHARPAPTFKPVTVHGSSTENLKIEHNHQNVKSPKTVNSSGGSENQKNMPPSKADHGSAMENLEIEHNLQPVKTPRTENASCALENKENEPHLNTQERCKKRRLFDAQIKKKEEEAEARRKREEIERLATMKNQEKEFRKTMELKARPMPNFKHPQIAKSKKPLTDPQSPAWSRKAKK